MKYSNIAISTLLGAVSFSVLCIESIPVSEFEALYSLYNATRGAQWKWKNTSEYGAAWDFSNEDADPCTDKWQGINCTSTSPYHVVQISLQSYKLNGTIPVTIDAFKNLTALDFSSNNIYGSIPASTGNLKWLQFLCLDYNFISGEIPHAIENLARLQVLQLSGNMFSSSLPNSIGDLAELTNLEIYNSHVTGTIPNSIGRLCKLQHLSLQGNRLEGTFPGAVACMTQLLMVNVYDNQLTGTISKSIGAWQNLTILYLDANHFSGPIPSSVGNFSKLTTWALNDNLFTGSIPVTMGLMRALEYFDFEVNGLTGQLPDSVGNCTNLWYINAQNNLLSGSLPSSLGDLSFLQQILVGNNSLVGTLPPSFGGLSQLRLFLFETSCIHGPIPTTYGSLAKLEYLNFGANLLSGALPDSMGGLESLKVLYLFNNSLSGVLPASIGQLRQVQELQLFNNKFSGTLPSSLQKLGNLSVVLLYSNRLTGTLDAVFNASTQVSLTAVQVSNNQLTGTLPEELFRLPRILTIAAVSNCFSGSLPDNICRALSLTTLALDGLRSASNCQNKIIPGLSAAYQVAHPWKGPMRSCLFMMPNLTTLHLSGNGITGALSGELHVGNQLLDLSLSHNVITGSIPRAIQTRAWTNLDLSYNRFSGELSRDFEGGAYTNGGTSAGSSLSLGNNRLSGRLPHSVYTSRGNVSVLNSNLFSCRVDRSDLPQQDSDVGNYQCGSATFNAPFFIWLGILVAVLACLTAAMAGAPSQLSAVAQALQRLQEWTRAAEVLTNDEEAPVKQQLVNYREVSKVFDRLFVVSLRCCALVLLVLAPLYIVLSATYGTVTYQSAYAVSAGFLSGAVPLALIMLSLVILMALLLRSFTSLLSATAAPSLSAERTVSVVTIDRPARERFAVYTAFIVINLTVVVGVNAAYVYVALYRSGTLLLIVQVMMSFFKLFWNKYCGSYLVMSITSYISGFESLAVLQYNKEFLSVQLVVTLFNSIGVPCLVVALISPNCFYNALVAAKDVGASYTFSDCTTGFNAQTDSCAFVSSTGTTSYSPPFAYSYQCSASLVTYYAPAFLYLCIAASVVVPGARLAAFALRKRAVPGTSWYLLLSKFLPRLWESSPAAGSAAGCVPDPWRPLFEANAIIVSILTNLGILLTFGAVFPPLALPLLATIGVTVLMSKALVGRWICLSVDSNATGSLAIIDSESRKIRDPAILTNALWVFLTASCCFYTLFLFDILGDAVGFDHACWVLVVMPLLPCALYAGRMARLRYFPVVVAVPAAARSMEAAEVELAEMAVKSALHGNREEKDYV
jgi:Leucine-rich repeat (LRR) protein